MEVLLIRHGQTLGNLEKRYVGSTDEEVLPESLDKLKSRVFHPVDAVFVSPKIRCLQTAKVIYKDMAPCIIEDFTECNFGNFEYKNYLELSGDEDYQKWIDSNGEIAFPGGESKEEFIRRCVHGFDQVMLQAISKNYATIALVVHGGTIMSILDSYSKPHKDYYEWQVGNAEGYQVQVDTNLWMLGVKELIVDRRLG